jgi:pSer/pThr/pTyr-binding forkhead associated (FHA) protein
MPIKEIITIGRSRNSDYRIDSNSASNEHGILIVSDKGKSLLIDCLSTNGTRLLSQANGQRISQSEVYAQDSVFFGDQEHLIQDIIDSKKASKPVNSESEFTRIRDPQNGSIKSTLR